MHKLLLASMVMSAGTPQVVVPTLMAPSSLSPMAMTPMTQMPSLTIGQVSMPAAPALTAEPMAAKNIVSPLISAAQEETSAGQMFDASVDRKENSAEIAASKDEALRAKASPQPSKWKYLSNDSMAALRALNEGGEMDGYKLLSRTGLDAERLLLALREISHYPLGSLAYVVGGIFDVGETRVTLLPSASGTIDFLLNEKWNSPSDSSLAVLRALKTDGSTSGAEIMRKTGFDRQKLSAVLAEIASGPSALVIVTGSNHGPELDFAMIAPLPSAVRSLEMLLSYRVSAPTLQLPAALLAKVEADISILRSNPGYLGYSIDPRVPGHPNSLMRVRHVIIHMRNHSNVADREAIIYRAAGMPVMYDYAERDDDVAMMGVTFAKPSLKPSKK